MYTTIVACTDDLSSMSYLNKWDEEIPRLDVVHLIELCRNFYFISTLYELWVKVDDYRSERSETMSAQGPKFSFSFGDYVAKALVGKWISS